MRCGGPSLLCSHPGRLVSGLDQGRPFTLSCFTPAHCSRAPTLPTAWVGFLLHRASHRWVPHPQRRLGGGQRCTFPRPSRACRLRTPGGAGTLRLPPHSRVCEGRPAQVVPAARRGPAGIPERSLRVGARSGLCITRADRQMRCVSPFPRGTEAQPLPRGPSAPSRPGEGRRGCALRPRCPLPAAPAPTFTRVAQQDGFRAAFCLPRSPERQPHAASSVSQAFKLPFYLNLCPRIQAEKGPFQSQFLFYGFMGDRIGQLPPVPRCSQHRGGSRGSGCSGRNPLSSLSCGALTEPRPSPRLSPDAGLRLSPPRFRP